LGVTLEAIFASARATHEPFEVLVVNDHSTDQTPAIAQQYGAQVIDVHLRKISAVRNAGAKAARGSVFIFIDADTQIPIPLISQILTTIEGGAVGGGAWVEFDPKIHRLYHLSVQFFNFIYMGILRWAAGCCMFAQREAFEAVGGFDETLYASEEIPFSQALKKQGHFVLLKTPVITSARKMRMYSPWWWVQMLGRIACHGPKILKQREGLEFWYDGKRESRTPPNS